MPTVSTQYVSGDRDNHANGLKIAVCSLFMDVCERLGLRVIRTLSGPGGDTVTFSVECSVNEMTHVVIGCHRRGMPDKLLKIYRPLLPLPPETARESQQEE